jgi:hypothetical protein
VLGTGLAIWVLGSCCGFGFYFGATALFGGWDLLRDPQYLLLIGGLAAFYGLLQAIGGDEEEEEDGDEATEPARPAGEPADAQDDTNDARRSTDESDGVNHL